MTVVSQASGTTSYLSLQASLSPSGKKITISSEIIQMLNSVALNILTLNKYRKFEVVSNI